MEIQGHGNNGAFVSGRPLVGGERRRMTSLDRVEENGRARVVDIQGGWGIRGRLGQMGIHPGDVLTVRRYGALRGPILIEVHGFQVALGRGIARRILVEGVE
jgi:ferrous iron transport protein A